MKPTQLLRDAGDDFERALFAAAEREPVAMSSKLDVARRLGLALPEVGELGTHMARSAPPSAVERAMEASAPSLASPLAASRAARNVWSKLTLLAVVGGLGWGGSLLGHGRAADGHAEALRAAVMAPISPTPAANVPPAPPVAAPRGAEELAPSATSPGRSRAVHPAASAPTIPRTAAPSTNTRTNTRASTAPVPAIADDALLREVRGLDGVRAALRAHDGARAVALLDSYASEFPHGELAIEGQVLRVAALLQTDQRAAAQALALRTLANPGGARYRSEIERSLQPPNRKGTAE